MHRTRRFPIEESLRPGERPKVDEAVADGRDARHHHHVVRALLLWFVLLLAPFLDDGISVGGCIGVHFDLGTHFPLSLGDRDIQLVALRLLPPYPPSLPLIFLHEILRF